MINVSVGFEDDYIHLNGKQIWLHSESAHFVVGKMNEQDEDGGDIDEVFPSLEQAIAYCLEQN